MIGKQHTQESQPDDAISERENSNLDKFKYLHKNVLNKESSRIASPSQVVDALKQLAEYLVWEDKNKQDAIFDYFCEENIMDYMTGVLCRSSSRAIRIQLVQTISMLIHNITNERTLYYLLSNNYINGLITVREMYSGGDVSSWTISLLKTLSSILNKSTIKFFFLQKNETFPLLDKSAMFLNDHDIMKRAHVMTIILNIFKVKDDDVVNYIINKSRVLVQLVLYLKYCWYRLNKYINKYKKFDENILIECDDILCFIEELMDLEIKPINEKIVYYTYNICFIPLVKKMFKIKDNTEGLKALKVPKKVDEEYLNKAYDEMSQSVGLIRLYIKNKTSLYNTFSDPSSNNELQLTEPLLKENQEPSSENLLAENEVEEEYKVKENNDLREHSSKNEGEEDKIRDHKEKFSELELRNIKEQLEIIKTFESEGQEQSVNNVIYYIVVNVLINSRRLELSKPLMLLFLSPFVTRSLLDELKQGSRVSSVVTTAMNSPTNINSMEEENERKNEKETREQKEELFSSNTNNYVISQETLNIYEKLIKFIEYYDLIIDNNNNNNYNNNNNDSTNNEDFVNNDLEDKEEEECVHNEIMGLFIYDGLESLKERDSKLLMLLKLLLNLQARIDESSKSEKRGKSGVKDKTEEIQKLLIRGLLCNNNIYLQLFNAIASNITNCKLNVVIVKMYSTMLGEYLSYLDKGEKVKNEVKEDKRDKIDENAVTDELKEADKRKKMLEQLREELRFHLDIIYNIIRLYVLNSIESTTLAYVSVFYNEWIKNVKLFYTNVHNLIHYDDILPIEDEQQLTEATNLKTEEVEDKVRKEFEKKQTKEQHKERLVRRLFSRNSRNNDADSGLSTLSTVQENYKDSPMNIFKRYIQIMLLFKELYSLINADNAKSLKEKVYIKKIEESLSFMYEACPLFYNRLESLYINDTQIKLGKVNGDKLNLGNLLRFNNNEVKCFKCIIRNKADQRERVFIAHDVFFILAKYKSKKSRHVKREKKEAGREHQEGDISQSLEKMLSIDKAPKSNYEPVNIEDFVNEKENENKEDEQNINNENKDDEYNNNDEFEKDKSENKEGPEGEEKVEEEQMSEKTEEKDLDFNLEITCVHFLWNCMVRKIDKPNHKFNIIISWHPNYKSITPNLYYNNSTNKWNEEISPVVSEFEIIFRSHHELNVALKLHNNNKKNISSNCLLSLQDYLYN